MEKITDSLYFVSLDPPQAGFRRFLCSWIYKDTNAVILIDPGPAATIDALFAALNDLDIRQIDYVLLTHIHLDHAGGLGLLLERYADAKVLCHPKGMQHLIAPAKLWEASMKILREMAQVYGEPGPVAENRLFYQNRLRIDDLFVQVYETPGHAAHHLSFKIGEILFPGEAAGIFHPLADDIYLRIAAPAGFDLQDYRKSLGLLRSIGADIICYGHYGYSCEAQKLIGMASSQIELWTNTIERYAEEESPHFEDMVFKALVACDPGLSRFNRLPPDVQTREMFFLGNSLRGFKLSLNKNR